MAQLPHYGMCMYGIQSQAGAVAQGSDPAPCPGWQMRDSVTVAQASPANSAGVSVGPGALGGSA